MSRRRLLSAFAALFAAPALAATSGTMFQHHDWELACDNTGTCRAAGYQADEDDLAMSLLLTRAAGPATPTTGEVKFGFYEDAPFAPGVEPAVTLSIAGNPFGRIALSDDAAGTLTAAQVGAVVAVLTGDDEIAFAADDGRRWVLSTHGSSAVLLKMDDVQGRVGTPGALVRPGVRDEESVPQARPRPVVRVPALPTTWPQDVAAVNDSEKIRLALKAAVGADDECPDLLDPDVDEAPLTVVRLSARKLLVSTRCWLAAYNAGSGYWVVNDVPDWEPVLVTTMGTDQADGTITASHKGRGLGDCWSTDTWSWDGTRFVPTGAETSGMCKLVAPGGAWSLPTLVTDVVRAEADAGDGE